MAGLRPVYLQVENEIPNDVLYALNSWRKHISKPGELVEVINNDKHISNGQRNIEREKPIISAKHICNLTIPLFLNSVLPANRSMDKFRTSHINPDDIPGIAVYLATKTIGVYNEIQWLQTLQWIWTDNPNIKPGDTTLGWLIRDTEENISGVLGNIPVQCMVYGEGKPSFWATTWFVDETVRNLSMDLFMRYVKQKGVLMSNTPNPSVETLLVKLLKYKRAGSPWFQGSYLFPLKPLKGFLAVRNSSAGAVKKAGVFIMASLLKLPQAFVFLRTASVKTGKQLSVKQVHDFSEATDTWFKEFSKQHPCVLVRSAEMYRWIFCHPQHKNIFKVFGIMYDGQLQGYLVFKTKYNAGAGFHYMELVDEAILPLPEKLLSQIMAKTYYEINKAAQNESLLIMRSNNQQVHASLRKLFGMPVKKVEKTYYKEPFLQAGDTPFLTSLDGDSIFF
jgi:hypothetical protein